MAIEWFVLQNSTQESWYEYEKVIVSEPSLDTSDGLLKFISFSEIKKPVLMDWTDVLYCDSGEGFEFVTSNNTGKFYEKPEISPRIEIDPETGQEKLVPWRFPLNGNVLQSGEECYLESTIKAVLRFDIKKPDTIISPTFTIK